MNNQQQSAAVSSGEHTAAPTPQVNAAVQESQRKAFVFYSNWYTDSIQSLTEEEQAHFLLVLVRYACEGTLPDDSVPPVLRTMFGLVRPAIDADLKKYDKIAETNRRRAEKRKKSVAGKEEVRCVENQRTTSHNPIINNQQSEINNQQSTLETEEKEEAQAQFSEVEAYWRERGFKSDAREFYNYYEAHGWLNRKGTRIQSWKKAALMWEDKFRRDVLPVRRREQAAEQAARRAARSAEAQQIRQKAREEHSAEAAHSAAVAVSRDVGRRMYAEALRMTNGDNDAALRLLRKAEDDPVLFRRLSATDGET